MLSDFAYVWNGDLARSCTIQHPIEPTLVNTRPVYITLCLSLTGAYFQAVCWNEIRHNAQAILHQTSNNKKGESGSVHPEKRWLTLFVCWLSKFKCYNYPKPYSLPLFDDFTDLLEEADILRHSVKTLGTESSEPAQVTAGGLCSLTSTAFSAHKNAIWALQGSATS